MKFFKKFLMPCGLCAAVPVLKNALPSDGLKPCSNEIQKKLIRPSELPIYPKEDACPKIPCPDNKYAPSYLEEGFGNIRRSLKGLTTQYQIITETVSNTISTGQEHSEYLVEYLRGDPNPWPRVGAITIGGLTGFLFSIRGGKFKKLVYSSTGAATVAAFCYPKEAREGVQLANYYMNIGYNFIYGVKPGDENQLEISWPEFPTSFSEFEDLVIDLGSAATSTIGSLVTKAIEAVKSKEAKPDEVTSKPKKDRNTYYQRMFSTDVPSTQKYEKLIHNHRPKTPQSSVAKVIEIKK